MDRKTSSQTLSQPDLPTVHEWPSANVVLSLCMKNAYVHDLKQPQMAQEFS
jgi:hypothetical protein